MSERATLEIEVAGHRARVEEITAELERLAGEAQQSGAAPPRKKQQQADLLRMELKGRAAAVEVGSARLRVIRD